jgi:hypothetical protein
MSTHDHVISGRDAKPRVVLALVRDHYVGVAEGLESLRQLGATPGVTLVVWSSATTIPSDLRDRFAMAVGGCRFVEALPSNPEALLAYQGVYVPVASSGLAFALSEGDDRDSMERTVLLAAFLGMPVAILGIGWVPNTNPWHQAGLGRAASLWPDAWRMRSQRLRQLGMEILRTPEQVADWAQRALDGPRMVDAAMIDGYFRRGQREVLVGGHTIVTPSAFDRLREYGMTLKMSGEKTWRLDE